MTPGRLAWAAALSPLACASAWAQEAGQDPALSAPGAGGVITGLVGVLAATVAVLALAWVVLRLLKRMQHGTGGDGELGFVRSLSVGPRERVTLVTYRDEVFVLGVTAGSITLLARLPREEASSPDAALPAESPDPPTRDRSPSS